MQNNTEKLASSMFNWQYIIDIAMEHKKDLIVANIFGILAVLAIVPIPLLLPFLVDEVLLNQPATMVETINTLFPPSWHGPVLYILFILFISVLLRLGALFMAISIKIMSNS